MFEWLIRIGIALAFAVLGFILMAVIKTSRIRQLEQRVTFWKQKYRELLGQVRDDKVRRLKV
jgi:uncharacterized integral membrane protein